MLSRHSVPLVLGHYALGQARKLVQARLARLHPLNYTLIHRRAADVVPANTVQYLLVLF